MAIQTLYHEGTVHNPIPMGQLPWWNALGSQTQSMYGESCAQLSTSTKQSAAGTHEQQQLMNKPNNNPAHFTIFPGESKDSGNGYKSQAVMSLQSAPSEHRARFELGFGQPMICAKYPYMDQCYGLFSTYGPQISGRVMLPLNLATEGEPIYVNAKQYNGIMRRRQSRAKAVLENKITKARKPYMHHSRHLHAMRRPRGCGGRFLNSKTSNSEIDGNGMKKAGEKLLNSHPSGSQSSEILQSDSGTFNSSKGANGGGSALSGSDVTSMYSRGDFEHFPINHLGLSFHSFPGMMDNGCGSGTVMPAKWVATADNCCNLKV